MTEDDGEFRPSESTMSNLTSLFDSNKPHPNENHPLTYVAPKAPKAGESCATLKQSGSKSSSNKELKIITSKSVRVYKLENGNYVNLGTAGIAIVGNHGLHLYQIILYKNNKDHLCKTHITPNFSLTVLENNYMSFYDNSGQNWSVLFSSSCNVQEFAKQMAIAKYNSQINQERIIIQDLSPLGGPKGKKRDIVEVAYTCSVLENDEVVPWKEKETVMIELTDVNSFPWHEGIKDWSEHCTRIVIIPYKLSAPWINDINENTSIVMELELVSITSSCLDKPLTQKEKEKEKPGERDIGMKTKGGGVMENRSHKTDIISRIAKLGQGLPVSGLVLSGPSDSEDECPSILRHGINLNSVKNAAQQLHRSLPIHVRQCSTEAENSHANKADDEIHRIEKITKSQEQKKVRRDTNVVAEEWEPCRNIEEKESKGSRCSAPSFADRELRISIYKLSEKVDEVLKKLQNPDHNKRDRLEERESGGVMDPISVLTSIPGFIVEHEHLRTEIEQQRHAIHEQNKKIEILTDLTQRCIEKCSITERKATMEKMEKMLSEKQVGNSEWSEATARSNESACDTGQYQKEGSSENPGVRYNGDLVDDLGKKQGGVHDSERKLDRTVADKECQVSWNGGEKKEILSDKTKDSGETCSGSKGPESISCEDSFEDIKRVMNAVNKKLQSYFEPGMNYSGNEVKAIIASTIKGVTVEYLRYKSKLRRSSGTEFSVRDTSERRFAGLREQRTEGEQQEFGSPSHVRETFSSIGNSGQRNSHDIRSVNSSRLAVNTSAKDTESGVYAEKSGSRMSEMESNRSTVSPEPSGISGVSDITATTRDDFHRRDTAEDRMKSASDSEKKYSGTHRPSFANEDPVLENIRETGSHSKGSSPSSRRTLMDAGEESVVDLSSLRSDNIGMTFSENQKISQQEIFVGSKSLIECRGDNDLEGEKCEITISKSEEDTKRVVISPSPSQKSTSITEGKTLESGKITVDDSPRLSGDEKIVEVGKGVLDIVESTKSVVSELTRKDAVKTISQPSTVTADNEESRLNEGIKGNGLGGEVARGIVTAKSEIVGIVDAEAKQSGKNLKHDISQKISNVRLKELPSLQSMSRVRSGGSEVDETFGEYNSGVSFRRTPNVNGIENGETEMLDENLTGREPDVQKSTVLTEPLSEISASRDENSSTDGNVGDVKISGGTEKYSAGAVDVAGSMVESEGQNGESKNESVRDEGLESVNAKMLPIEEKSYGSGTEKAVSPSKITLPDGIEPDEVTSERSTVSKLARNLTEEGIAGSSARMKNGVENGGVTSRRNTSNQWEAVESRPLSTRSTVTEKASVIGVESREGEDGEMRSTEGKAEDKENEKNEMERGSLDDYDQESLTGQENIKSSGANSANGACHFPDHYQNWILSKPPPLPLEEEDDEDDDDINIIDNDEEWL